MWKARNHLLPYLKEKTRVHEAIKFNLELFSTYVKQTKDISSKSTTSVVDTTSFMTAMTIATQPKDIEEDLVKIFQESAFSLAQVLKIEIYIN